MTVSRTNFTDEERQRITHELLIRCSDLVLPSGTYTDLAERWDCHPSTISRIWNVYCAARASGTPIDGCKSRKAKHCGWKRKNREEAKEKLRSVPLEDRQVIRGAAAAADLSKYMVGELLKEGEVSRRSTLIKPCLTDKNKLRRIEFALSFVDESRMIFEPLYIVVHVDEKWFNSDKDKRSFIMLEGEELPVRKCQSKRHITKTMFLAAVARPRFDPHRNADRDGKLGITHEQGKTKEAGHAARSDRV